jgi:hypothetical protein
MNAEEAVSEVIWKMRLSIFGRDTSQLRLVMLLLIPSTKSWDV